MYNIQAPWIGKGPEYYEDDYDKEEKYLEDQENIRDWRRDMEDSDNENKLKGDI